MIKNKVKKFVAAAALLSLSSLSAAQGPLEPVTNILGGLADVNSLPINPLSLIAGGGLSGVPTSPALLFGLLPSGGEFPVDILAFIPI